MLVLSRNMETKNYKMENERKNYKTKKKEKL